MASRLSGEERIKRPSESLLIHADASVCDRNENVLCVGIVARISSHSAVVSVGGLNCKLATIRHRIASVHGQVQERILKFQRVGVNKSSIK